MCVVVFFSSAFHLLSYNAEADMSYDGRRCLTVYRSYDAIIIIAAGREGERERERAVTLNYSAFFFESVVTPR